MHQQEEMFTFVKRRLDETKNRWTDAAKFSGVPYDTVKKIAQGKTKNPTVDTVQKLANYFHRLDAFEAEASTQTATAA